jgi:hypothetical protein
MPNDGGIDGLASLPPGGRTMRPAAPPAVGSYRKTALASATLAAALSVLGGLALWTLPTILGVVVAAVLLSASLGAAVIASGGLVVLARCKASALREPDLFLRLNRSREPDAILERPRLRKSRAQRWLARRLLGHDLLVGDAVEVRTWPEIRATLDERGALDGLPFMPEMLPMCGRRATVFRCMHRLFDYRKSRLMRHMEGAVLLTGVDCDGASHGGCEAACHTIWKSAWLRRIEEPRLSKAAEEDCQPQGSSGDPLLRGRGGPPYSCQLTQLHDASRPIRKRSVRQFVLPLASGNVAPGAFAVGWLTYLFNEIQQLRGGVDFPAFPDPVQDPERPQEARLSPGDPVVVRSAAEIRSTLDDRSLHRGLYFEPDMMKHCGQRRSVEAEVTKLIDIVTGDMRVMKTPAYILRGVRFSGERQLFNSQWEPLFWRTVWLRRDQTP